jgi:hypothetical protein
MAHYNLSFHDLMLLQGFKEIVDSGNTKMFEEVLYANGMDTALGYEMVFCQHRVLPRRGEAEGKLYEGIRVEGFERVDEDWLATGAASLEAQIEGCKDLTLRRELRKMAYKGASSLEALADND